MNRKTLCLMTSLTLTTGLAIFSNNFAAQAQTTPSGAMTHPANNNANCPSASASPSAMSGAMTTSAGGAMSGGAMSHEAMRASPSAAMSDGAMSHEAMRGGAMTASSDAMSGSAICNKSESMQPAAPTTTR
jgi:hypothetical protein